MNNISDSNIQVYTASGQSHTVSKIGDIHGIFVNKNGNSKPITFLDVRYIPGFHFNLLILTTAMDGGYVLGSQGKEVNLNKKNICTGLNQLVIPHWLVSNSYQKLLKIRINIL